MLLSKFAVRDSKKPKLIKEQEGSGLLTENVRNLKKRTFDKILHYTKILLTSFLLLHI